MSRVAVPWEKIEASFGFFKPVYSIDAVRMYKRVRGKFVAIGWTGNYRFFELDQQYHEDFEFSILDSELE